MSPRLEELCLEITGRCQMRCMHCSSSCTSDNDIILSRDKVRDLLQEAKFLGARVIEISGGEPFLHPDLLGIISDAKKDFEVRLYTSGYISGEGGNKIGEERLIQLHRLGLDKIIYNLEGATQKTHEGITRTDGSFWNVLSGIRSAKNIGIWTGVHFVPMRPNYRELESVARLCVDLKVDELAVLRFVNQGRGKKYESMLSLSAEEFRELLHSIIRLKRVYTSTLHIRTGCPLNFCSILEESSSSVQCKAGQSTLLVGFNGNVSLCPAFKQADLLTLGNVWKRSLQRIWNNNNLLASFREMDIEEVDICNECNYRMTCRGRCVAQRYYEYGDIKQGPDPLCPIMEDMRLTQTERKIRAIY